MSEKGMAMKERRIRQPGLFDAVMPPAEPSMTHGAETLAMLLAGCEFQAPQKCLKLINVYAISFIP